MQSLNPCGEITLSGSYTSPWPLHNKPLQTAYTKHWPAMPEEKKYRCRVETNWWVPKDKCTPANGLRQQGQRVIEGISYFEVTTPKGGSRAVWWEPGFKELYKHDSKLESVINRCIGLDRANKDSDEDLVTYNGTHFVEFTKTELQMIDIIATELAALQNKQTTNGTNGTARI